MIEGRSAEIGTVKSIHADYVLTAPLVSAVTRDDSRFVSFLIFHYVVASRCGAVIGSLQSVRTYVYTIRKKCVLKNRKSFVR